MPVPNLNHHLWRNGRLWWIAFTVVYDGWRQERVRRSLHTAELDEARRLRDELLRQYAAAPNAEVVAFKLQGDASTPFRLEPDARDRDAYGAATSFSAQREASRV